MSEQFSDQDALAGARRDAMGLFARATEAELSRPISERWGDLDVHDLRLPEIGLVMLRGRMGGDGQPFNFGEATVTRAVVELATGQRGYGQRLGRAAKAARLAAIADCLWQDERTRADIERFILVPIRERLAAESVRVRAETAATKVDFFTLVRGDA